MKTEFDLRQWTTLDDALNNTAEDGYDINFAVSCSASTLLKGPCLAAELVSILHKLHRIRMVFNFG